MSPLILVGHSLGGLILKEVCLLIQMHDSFSFCSFTYLLDPGVVSDVCQFAGGR